MRGERPGRGKEREREKENIREEINSSCLRIFMPFLLGIYDIQTCVNKTLNL